MITTAITRESSKANAEAVKVLEDSVVKQVTKEDGGWQKQLQKIQGDLESQEATAEREMQRDG